MQLGDHTRAAGALGAERPVWREGVAVFLGGLVVAVAAFWPLALHLSTHVPSELADPLLQAWQVAWGGHALATQPLDFFQSNSFYPLRNSLAFSDALVGYSPTGLIGDGVGAALARYNVLFLVAYAVAGTGAYLLTRELALRPAAALVAAAAFAFAPWRLEQSSHLHVLSSGGIPLALFLLVRGYRRGSPGLVVAGWLVAAWQLSLGFTLGLPLAYGLALAAAGAAVVWLVRGRPALPRPLVVATAVGLVAFAVVAGVLAQPYLQVLDDHPEAHRSIAEVGKLSPPPRSFVAAPRENLIWGGATASVRDSLPWGPEQTLFPGLAILVLAGVGALWGPWPRRLRIGIALVGAVVAFLATGLRIADGWLGYRWLYEYAPGWDGLRTPGRLYTFTSLALALLAAAGAQVAVGAAQRRRAWAGAAAGVLLAAVIVVEGLGPPPVLRVPDPPRGLSSAPEPLLNLPLPGAENAFTFSDFSTFYYMLWSTDGFPRIVNGTSGFTPTFTSELPKRVEGFPNRSSIRFLRGIGVRGVVLHPRAVERTAWPARRARAADLGVRVRRSGDVVIYGL
jgi:hypothetical protein